MVRHTAERALKAGAVQHLEDRLIAMNSNTTGSDQAYEEALTYEVPDEALETAAGTRGAASPALSFNFSSFHLQCC
jgi:hypothetical protein